MGASQIERSLKLTLATTMEKFRRAPLSLGSLNKYCLLKHFIKAVHVFGFIAMKSLLTLTRKCSDLNFQYWWSIQVRLFPYIVVQRCIVLHTLNRYITNQKAKLVYVDSSNSKGFCYLELLSLNNFTTCMFVSVCVRTIRSSFHE